MSLKKQRRRAESIVEFWPFIGAVAMLVVFGRFIKVPTLTVLTKAIIAFATFIVYLAVAWYLLVRSRNLHKKMWGYEEKPKDVVLTTRFTMQGEFVEKVECSYDYMGFILCDMPFKRAKEQLLDEGWIQGAVSGLRNGKMEYRFTKEWEE